MTETPTTVPQLIDAFGGPAEFARLLGLRGASTASEMKRSASIRVLYWPMIVEAARTKGRDDITYEAIARMHLSTEIASSCSGREQT